MTDVNIKEIQVNGWESLQIDPGDIVLVRVPDSFSPEEQMRIAQSCQEFSLQHGLVILLIPAALDVSVLKREIDRAKSPIIQLSR